jgi:excisionase family DNA binding protein
MAASPDPTGPRAGRRFLTLADVAEILSTSVAQVRALVHSGELRYIQIGGRQQYRIEAVELENYIQRMYARTDARAVADPDGGPGTGPDAAPAPAVDAGADGDVAAGTDRSADPLREGAAEIPHQSQR